jgi:hypothetical protein
METENISCFDLASLLLAVRLARSVSYPTQFPIMAQAAETGRDSSPSLYNLPPLRGIHPSRADAAEKCSPEVL